MFRKQPPSLSWEVYKRKKGKLIGEFWIRKTWRNTSWYLRGMIQFNEQTRVVVDLYLWGVERKEQIAGIRLGRTGRADQSLQSPLSPPRSFSGFCAPPHLNCSLHACHSTAPPLPDLPSLLSSAPWRGKLLQTTRMTCNVFWSTGHKLLDAWRPSEKLLKNHNNIYMEFRW